LDGVCGDHNLIFRNIVAKELSVDPETLPLERSWGFKEWGLSPEDFEKLHERAVVEHRMFRDMPVIDGVAETLWRLSDQGVWIRIISHRLYVNWGHAVAAGDTADWLDRAQIPYRDLCFIGAKSALHADLYIDDGPHNIEAFHADGRKVIIYDQPYNRHLDGKRAYNWKEVEQFVLGEIALQRGGAEQQLPGLDAGADRIERRKSSPSS
jgi:5'(3')-deoxyribonucleotidase